MARAITGGEIYWGVIDEDATKRLRKAYPRASAIERCPLMSCRIT
jgi:hypothetical protein